MRLPEFVAAADRVFSAMSCRKPTKTTDHSAVSATSRTRPIGPLSMWMPNGSDTSTMSTAMRTPLHASAMSRPKTIDERGTGVARSLSK